jgi:hypothetical protein
MADSGASKTAASLRTFFWLVICPEALISRRVSGVFSTRDAKYRPKPFVPCEYFVGNVLDFGSRLWARMLTSHIVCNPSAHLPRKFGRASPSRLPYAAREAKRF